MQFCRFEVSPSERTFRGEAAEASPASEPIKGTEISIIRPAPERQKASFPGADQGVRDHDPIKISDPLIDQLTSRTC